jgi:ATP-dependent Clp protease protease subunit
MINWKRKLSEEESDDTKQSFITLDTNSILNNAAPVGNKIYLYDDISRNSVLTVSKHIDEITRQLKLFQMLYNFKEAPAIELHISSDGGEISPALSLVDKIQTNPVEIHTYCEGFVASAGTLISVSGKKRFITQNSNVLLHQLSGGIWGPYESISDEKSNLDLFMKMIKTVYLKHTNFKSKQLEDLLKHDLCLTSDQALSFGIVDTIL